MPERDDAEDFGASFKGLAVFRTLRSNLALFSAFARQSGLDPENYSGQDLGLLGVEAGENQLKIHNRAMGHLLLALVAQALNNHVELRRINPRLEDADLEKFLDGLGDRDRFVRGMTNVRNAVFHVKSRRAWLHRDVVFLDEVFQQRVESCDSDVLGKLSVLLYDFTQKCFMGDLKIWPLRLYEEQEALDPEVRARMDAGEASFEEVIEALRANRDRE